MAFLTCCVHQLLHGRSRFVLVYRLDPGDIAVVAARVPRALQLGCLLPSSLLACSGPEAAPPWLVGLLCSSARAKACPHPPGPQFESWNICGEAGGPTRTLQARSVRC